MQKPSDTYTSLAAEIVQQALAAGATDAECTISEGDEFSANVRLREVETLKEAGSRGAGLRILRGRHTGSAYTSDLSADGIRHMVLSAIELAEITTEDPTRRRVPVRRDGTTVVNWTPAPSRASLAI